MLKILQYKIYLILLKMYFFIEVKSRLQKDICVRDRSGEAIRTREARLNGKIFA